jgi:hypothetical protein
MPPQLRLLFCLVAFWCVPVLAQRDVYPEKLHQDVDLLVSSIQRIHPDPYRYTSEQQLKRIVKLVKDSVRVPMDAHGFMQRLMPIFHAIGDRNCVPEMPAMVRNELMHRTALLPMKVRIREDGVHLEEELKGFRSIPSGSRILSINGRAIEEVVAMLGDGIVRDGSNRTFVDRSLEHELHFLHALHLGEAGVYEVEYVAPGGEKSRTQVFPMNGDEIARSRKPVGASLLPWGAQRVEDDRSVWVNIRTFDQQEVIAAEQRPEKFIEALLDELQEFDVSTLVIDLRGAGGMDLILAEQLFAAIAREPFSILQQTKRYEFEDPLAMKGDGTLDRRKEVHDHPLKQAHSRAFQGRVYVVSDGGTRDMAAAFVMLAHRTGRARTFGKETGTNAVSFTGARRTIILPNSGLEIAIPTEQYIPYGTAKGERDRGEPVDHALETDQRSLAAGRDGVKAALLRLIGAVQ